MRELSWRRATLEQIFTRIALGLDLRAEPESRAAPAAVHTEPTALEVNLPGNRAPADCAAPGQVPSAPAAPGKLVYNLNPFDKGASRDLGKPKPQA